MEDLNQFSKEELIGFLEEDEKEIEKLTEENKKLTTKLNNADSLIKKLKENNEKLGQKLDTKTDRDLENEKESKRLNDLQENLKAQQKSLNQEKQDVADKKTEFDTYKSKEQGKLKEGNRLLKQQKQDFDDEVKATDKNLIKQQIIAIAIAIVGIALIVGGLTMIYTNAKKRKELHNSFQNTNIFVKEVWNILTPQQKRNAKNRRIIKTMETILKIQY